MEDIPKPGPDTRPFRPQHLTTADIKSGCIKLYGLDFVEEHEKSITIFGSARTAEGNKYYEKARRIGYRTAHELGYAVITGGGPGIMEAGNRGAYEANGTSVGISIELPHEQMSNPYLTVDLPFYFFFTRKTVMRYASRAYLFFPGGYGTMDELMESLTLVQTGKTAPIPIILVGKEFWEPLDHFIKKDLQEDHMIGEFDPNLYTILDDEDQIMEMIKNAPMRAEKK
jgi:uncharacterized protein (TIGR00730 family)